MKRLLAVILLLLYLYNFVGYLILFAVIQSKVHREVTLAFKKKLLDSELVRLSFATAKLHNGPCGIVWMKEKEFRFKGMMYDVFRSFQDGDTTHFLCINDAQEERLFVNLEGHVRRHVSEDKRFGKLEMLKNSLNDSFTTSPLRLLDLEDTGLFVSSSTHSFESTLLDPPFHPPRNLSGTFSL